MPQRKNVVRVIRKIFISIVVGFLYYDYIDKHETNLKTYDIWKLQGI